ncbi:MAG: hypothetical protein DIU80_004965 [Chloroflexota bacterium]
MKRYRLSIALTTGLIALLAIVAVSLVVNPGTQAEEGRPLLEYPSYPPTPTIGPANPNKAAVASGALLFSDSFDTEQSLASWEVVDLAETLPEDQADWLVQEGRLVQNATTLAGMSSARETLLVTGNAGWTDYVVSADAYDLYTGNFGVVARRQGNSFYRYQVVADELPDGPKHILEKVVDGKATRLAVLDGPGYSQRAWHNIALSVQGSQIRAYLDGQLILEATDSELTSGQAGLFTRPLAGILFDNATVTRP